MIAMPLAIDQNRLIDHLLKEYGMKNDAQLSRELGVAPPVISKVRHHALAVGPALKVRMMEKLGIELRTINELLAPVL